MRKLLCLLGVLVSVCASPISLRAQTTYATITGTVTDANGAILPGVRISVRSMETNISSETVSNEEGVYTITQLREGTYTLSARASGFREFIAKDILLVARDVRRLDINLALGEMKETVQVSAGATLIETETPRIGDTRTANELKTLPLNTRGIWAYLSLSPMIVQRAGGSTISFAGSRSNQSQWSIDGTTMSDGVNETQIGPLANFIESFKEVKIDLANNSSEFGTLGFVTLISKSGDNDFHGSVFDYYTSPILRTRNPFATQRSGGVNHNIGFSASGPIYLPKLYNGKDRTFWFISAETTTGSQATSNLNSSVPLEAWRRGDFSALGIQLRNPFTNEVYPDGKLPPTLINPVAKKIQDRFYPLPNFGDVNAFTSGNFRLTVPRPFNTPKYLVGRFDQKFGSKDTVYARYTVHQQVVADWEGDLPSFGPRRQFRRNKALTVSYGHTFSPTLLNEFRFGHTFNNNPLEGPLNGLEVVKDLGIQGLAPDLPNIGGVFRVNFSGIGLTGLSQINWTRPGFLNKIRQLQDQVSYFRGKHSFKMGAEIRKVRWDSAGAGNSLFGNVTFGNTYTRVPGVSNSGHPYADFLLGVPTSASREFPPLLIERSRWMYEFFFQDDWKITPRLTVNLGLRYEYHPVWQEDKGLQASFDIRSGKIAVADAGFSKISPLVPPGYVEIVKASSLGLPSWTLVRTDKNNFAPRTGIAYRLSNHTVARAGFGIYYDTTPINPSAGGVPFRIGEPGFTNTTPTPTLVLPQAFPATGTGGPSTISLPAAINPDLQLPYSQQWNLTVEHQRWNTGFRLSYVGANTRQMRYDFNINAPAIDDRLYINKPRRFPSYPGISYFDNGANHNYHALSLEAERKLAQGLYYQTSYTWARDVGDATEGSIENPFDRGRERAVDQSIPTHRFNNAVIYELPIGPGRKWLSDAPRALELAIGGWQISAITYFQTGMFLTPTISIPDPTGTVFTTSANRPLVTIRPDQLRNPNLSNPTIDRWFDPSAFAAAPIGRFGTSARGAIIGPGTNVWHVGFHKYVTFKDNPRIPKFRVELTSTNFFNHPNWANPDTNLSNAGSVATIRGVGGPNTASTGDQAGQRSLRLGLRIEW
ncbi:MAG TPA: TonB-dependent receptor [Blastocatellia bacterium]|nr:TonB-dependent receptor [Blastocatellia bacterium]